MGLKCIFPNLGVTMSNDCMFDQRTHNVVKIFHNCFS